MTAPSPPPRRDGALQGARVIGVGLVMGLVGLAVSQFLAAIVANTPVRLSSYSLFWITVLLTGCCGAAGMAVEAVRQLQAANPDPEYRRAREERLRRGRR